MQLKILFAIFFRTKWCDLSELSVIVIYSLCHIRVHFILTLESVITCDHELLFIYYIKYQ